MHALWAIGSVIWIGAAICTIATICLIPVPLRETWYVLPSVLYAALSVIVGVVSLAASVGTEIDD